MSPPTPAALLDQLDDLLDALDASLTDDPPLVSEPRPDTPPPADHRTVALPAPTDDDRRALVAEGVAAARAALGVIRRAFDDGVADFDDAVKALPALHKILEHAERMEVARQSPGQWPTAPGLVIVIDPNVKQELPAIPATRPLTIDLPAAPTHKEGPHD